MFSLLNKKHVKQIIHILYNKSFEIMQKKLKDSITYCSLTTDLWTSRNRQGYLGITCSWLDSDFKIHEVLLSLTYIRYPHTADVIKEKLEETIEAWGLTEKVYSITTDNGTNIKAAIKKMNNIVRIPCLAHTLQ